MRGHEVGARQARSNSLPPQFHRTPPALVTIGRPTGGTRVCWQRACLGRGEGCGESSFEGESRKGHAGKKTLRETGHTGAGRG